MNVVSGGLYWFLHLDADAEEHALVKDVVDLFGIPFHIHQFFRADRALRLLAAEGIFADPRAYPFPKFVLMEYELAPRKAPQVVMGIRKLPRGKKMPIIVYARGDSPANVAACYQAGADYFLVKAIKPSRIKAILEALYECQKESSSGFDSLCQLPEYRGASSVLPNSPSEGRMPRLRTPGLVNGG
jgi:DNA-binding response OmpR family regulator